MAHKQAVKTGKPQRVINGPQRGSGPVKMPMTQPVNEGSGGHKGNSKNDQ
jgi:hypothetical protein